MSLLGMAPASVDEFLLHSGPPVVSLARDWCVDYLVEFDTSPLTYSESPKIGLFMPGVFLLVSPICFWAGYLSLPGFVGSCWSRK